MLLRVHLLPQLVKPDDLAGSTCVVIDVLRATTTIAHALAAGAREVLPCLTVDEARQKAAGFASGEVVLGGERGGVRIDGFDFGNSP
jgi:2-phosphosulfolactate phosphatase